jgi:hypothetical protein
MQNKIQPIPDSQGFDLWSFGFTVIWKSYNFNRNYPKFGIFMFFEGIIFSTTTFLSWDAGQKQDAAAPGQLHDKQLVLYIKLCG